MIPHKNIAKDIGRILFWFPLRWCVLSMSFRGVYALGTLIGSLDYYMSGKKTILKMRTNLVETFGFSRSKADRIIMKNLQHHSRNVLELIKYPQINQKNMSEIIRFKGLEHLDKALESKNGVILMTAHFGAKQALQLGLGFLKYPLTQIHYHMQKEELTWVQKNISQKQRIKIESTIPINFISSQGFLGSAVKSLKKNKILLIGGDGIGIKKYMGKGYMAFPFLGRSMLFPTGSVVLAKWTKASILPVFAVRENHRHQIVIEPPIHSKLSDNDMLKKYIHTLERYIRSDPSLWEFWEEFDQETLIDPNTKILK